MIDAAKSRAAVREKIIAKPVLRVRRSVVRAASCTETRGQKLVRAALQSLEGVSWDARGRSTARAETCGYGGGGRNHV